jgi:hydrogenase nickel incorporation protein HypA/HybF
MHELAIADGLVKAVIQEMQSSGVPAGSLRKATVVVGALQQVVPENLQQAYDMLTRDTAAEGSELYVKTVPVEITCHACGWNGHLRDRLYRCTQCNATDVTITEGRELYLASLEVDDRDH